MNPYQSIIDKIQIPANTDYKKWKSIRLELCSSIPNSLINYPEQELIKVFETWFKYIRELSLSRNPTIVFQLNWLMHISLLHHLRGNVDHVKVLIPYLTELFTSNNHTIVQISTKVLYWFAEENPLTTFFFKEPVKNASKWISKKQNGLFYNALLIFKRALHFSLLNTSHSISPIFPIIFNIAQSSDIHLWLLAAKIIIFYFKDIPLKKNINLLHKTYSYCIQSIKTQTLCAHGPIVLLHYFFKMKPDIFKNLPELIQNLKQLFSLNNDDVLFDILRFIIDIGKINPNLFYGNEEIINSFASQIFKSCLNSKRFFPLLNEFIQLFPNHHKLCDSTAAFIEEYIKSHPHDSLPFLTIPIIFKTYPDAKISNFVFTDIVPCKEFINCLEAMPKLDSDIMESVQKYISNGLDLSQQPEVIITSLRLLTISAIKNNKSFDISIQQIESLISYENEEVRLEIINYFSSLISSDINSVVQESIKNLYHLFQFDKYKSVRLAALKALPIIQGNSHIFLQAITDSSYKVRRIGLKKLSKMISSSPLEIYPEIVIALNNTISMIPSIASPKMVSKSMSLLPIYIKYFYQELKDYMPTIMALLLEILGSSDLKQSDFHPDKLDAPEMKDIKQLDLAQIIRKDVFKNPNSILSHLETMPKEEPNRYRLFLQIYGRYIDQRDGYICNAFASMGPSLLPFLNCVLSSFFHLFAQRKNPTLLRKAANSLRKIACSIGSGINLRSYCPVFIKEFSQLLANTKDEQLASSLLRLLGTTCDTFRINYKLDEIDTYLDLLNPSYFTDFVLSTILPLFKSSQNLAMYECVTRIFSAPSSNAAKFTDQFLPYFVKALSTPSEKERETICNNLIAITYLCPVESMPFLGSIIDGILPHINEVGVVKLCRSLSFHYISEFKSYVYILFGPLLSNIPYLLNSSNEQNDLPLFRPKSIFQLPHSPSDSPSFSQMNSQDNLASSGRSSPITINEDESDSDESILTVTLDFIAFAIIYQGCSFDALLSTIEKSFPILPENAPYLANILSLLLQQTDISLFEARLSRLLVRLIPTSKCSEIYNLILSLGLCTNISISKLESLLRLYGENNISDNLQAALSSYPRDKESPLLNLIEPKCDIQLPTIPKDKDVKSFFMDYDIPSEIDVESWLEKLCTRVVSDSHVPVIRACQDLVGISAEFRRLLFPIAFFSCWQDASDEDADHFSSIIQQILETHSHVNQEIIHLAETLDRACYPLNISDLNLANASDLMPLSLYYYQRYLRDHQDDKTAVENLLSLNTRMDRKASTHGILTQFGQQLPSEATAKWSELLRDWQTALDYYDNDNSTISHRIRCHSHLDHWEEIRNLEPQMKYLSPTEREANARYIAWAFYHGGLYDKVEEALKNFPPELGLNEIIFKSFYYIKIKLYDEANKLIQSGFDLLAKERQLYSSKDINRMNQNLSFAQLFVELQDALDLSINPNRLEEGSKASNKRLKGFKRSSDTWIKLIEIRSLVFSPETDLSVYLKMISSLRNERKWSMIDTYFPKFFNHIFNPQVELSRAKEFYARGQTNKAISNLQWLISISKPTISDTIKPALERALGNQSKTDEIVSHTDAILYTLIRQKSFDSELKKTLFENMHINNINEIDSLNEEQKISALLNLSNIEPSKTSQCFNEMTSECSQFIPKMYRYLATFLYDSETHTNSSLKEVIQFFDKALQFKFNHNYSCTAPSSPVRSQSIAQHLNRRSTQITNNNPSQTNISRSPISFKKSNTKTNQNQEIPRVQISSIPNESIPSPHSPKRATVQRVGMIGSNHRVRAPLPASISIGRLENAILHSNYEDESDDDDNSDESDLRNSTDYRIWLGWAKANSALIDILPREQRNEANIAAVNAVTGFLKAAQLSGQNALEYLCQMFAIFFRMTDSRLITKSLRKEIIGLPTSIIQQILPQIAAQICHRDSTISDIVKELLNNFGQHHFEELFFQLNIYTHHQSYLESYEPVVVPREFTRMNRKELLQREQSMEVLRMGQSKSESVCEILEYLGDKNREIYSDAKLFVDGMLSASLTAFEQWVGALDAASLAHIVKNKEKMEAILREQFERFRNPKCEVDKFMYRQEYTPISQAESLFNQKTGQALTQMWNVLKQLYHRLVDRIKRLELIHLPTVSPELAEKRAFKISIPGTYSCEHPVPTIERIEPALEVLGTQQRPRCLFIVSSAGEKVKFLLKGNEDLRRDKRVMQFFALVNSLLNHSRLTRGIGASIEEYAIVPLSPSAGLIRWVTGADTLHQMIVGQRELNGTSQTLEYDVLENVNGGLFSQLTNVQKLEAFYEIQEECPGTEIREFFWTRAPNSATWLERSRNFCVTTALMSMIGYVIGLGDRHPSNIMVQSGTGRVIHIDFGDSFEAAIIRDNYPEKVPFRLTRMIENGLDGGTVEGMFREVCQDVMWILRDNRASLLALLEIFIHEPLEEENSTKPKMPSATVILERVSDKLNGHDFQDDMLMNDSKNERIGDGEEIKKIGCKDLGVEEQVDKLIKIAADPARYVTHYPGWCPLW